MCGNYGVDNIGDEAILNGLKIALRKADKECAIEVLGKGSHVPFGLRSLIFGFRRPIKAIKRCDVFVLGGGGLFTNEEGFFVPLFWALQAITAILFKKKLLCLGISIGRLSFLDRLILKFLFARANLITVRDEKSLSILNFFGILAHMTSDLALLQENKFMPSQIIEKPYVVISLRPFRNNNEKLYTILVQFCDSLITEYGLNIMFLPFQAGADKDGKILNKIFDQVKQKDSVFVSPFSDDFSQIRKILAGAECVIAMRLHAGILSMLSGTPFIPLVYMEKVRDFWISFKEIPTLEIKQLQLEKLMSAFTEIWNNRRKHQQLVQRIRERMTADAAKTVVLIQDAIREN